MILIKLRYVRKIQSCNKKKIYTYINTNIIIRHETDFPLDTEFSTLSAEVWVHTSYHYWTGRVYYFRIINFIPHVARQTITRLRRAIYNQRADYNGILLPGLLVSVAPGLFMWKYQCVCFFNVTWKCNSKTKNDNNNKKNE